MGVPELDVVVTLFWACAHADPSAGPVRAGSEVVAPGGGVDSGGGGISTDPSGGSERDVGVAVVLIVDELRTVNTMAPTITTRAATIAAVMPTGPTVRRVGAGVGSAANGGGGCFAGLGFGLVGVDSATAVAADLGRPTRSGSQ